MMIDVQITTTVADTERYRLNFPALPRSGDLITVVARHFRVEDVEWIYHTVDDCKNAEVVERLATPVIHCYEVA